MKKLSTILFAVCLAACETTEVVAPDNWDYEGLEILSFSVEGQTLPTRISERTLTVMAEVNQETDLGTLVPDFTLPEGSTASISNVEQVSGSTPVDFSSTVTYSVTNKSGNSREWNINISPLSCKILIDASHGGGTWWYPQYGTFDQDQYHQGQSFANHLRDKGFIVDELPRGIELTEELFFGYYVVIRTNGFTSYTPSELEVYRNVMSRGMNLALFTDHKRNDRVDELAEELGLYFEGVATGMVSKFVDHAITENMDPFSYIAGSALMNSNDPEIHVLGWLSGSTYTDLNFNGIKDKNEEYGMPVMGIKHDDLSNIFFFGDMNAFQARPQPFIDNLINWLGECPL